MLRMKRQKHPVLRKKITWGIRGLLLCAIIYYTSVNVSISETLSFNSISHSSRRLLTNDTCEDPLEKELANTPRIPDAFTAAQLRSGFWVFYVPGVLYMFLGLSVVCDEFFVPALEAAAEAWNLSNDVAGATLMAAGGSAPELATSFIGTFMGSDIGFGTIVGSAVFNVFFVIAMCVLYSPSVLELTPWPLFRDCCIYALSLFLLALFFSVVTPNQIDFWEALILVGLYFFYVFIMSKNEMLQDKFNSMCNKSSEDHKELDDIDDGSKDEKKMAAINRRQSVAGQYRAGFFSLIAGEKSLDDMVALEVVAKIHGDVKETFATLDEDNSKTLDMSELGKLVEKCQGFPAKDEQVEALKKKLDVNGDNVITLEEFQEWYARSECRIAKDLSDAFKEFDKDGSGKIEKDELENILKLVMGKDQEVDEAFVTKTMTDIDGDGSGSITQDEFNEWYYKSEHFKTKQKFVAEQVDTYEGVSLSFPTDAGCSAKLMWFITMPLVLPMYYTCPNVQKPHLTKWWPLSFFMSIVWIGIFSVFMVQWASTLGLSISIPPKVMGLVFVAAGTSIPDLLTSVLVAMKGNGDMAVSSSIGSNIFDVLIGLPLPWLIKGLIDGPVAVGGPDDPVGVSVGLLFLMIILVVASIAAVGWKMDKKLAFLFILFYVVYLIQELTRYYTGAGSKGGC